MLPAVRTHFTTLILWAAPLAVSACGGEGGTDVVLPSLRITTVTSGVDLDLDGYSVSTDGGPAGPIGLDATITVDRLSDGAHTVELSGVAQNCTVAGENPRTVNISTETTATVAFDVTCVAETGTVRVATTTSGSATDPDGFSLLLDGTSQGSIGVSATSSLAGVSPGDHDVGLTDLAPNCQVAGDNPQSVLVPAGGMAEVSFAVTCTAPGPTNGTIEVATSTSGAGTDPDGFSLLLDGASQGPIGVSATIGLAGLTPGAHSVGLTGLAANCRVTGANPQSVAVPAGGTVRAVFAVACTAAGPTTGTLVITTATSGPAQDADGYLLSVDRGPTQPIGTAATITLSNVSAAQHTVELQGLAVNCTVTGNNPVGTAVGAGETGRVSFAVTCAATVGALAVTVAGLPAGANAAVTVSGPGNFSQPVSGTRTLSGLTPGTYTVTAQSVTHGGTTYTATASRPSVPVTVGATATVTVSHTPVAAAPTLNFRIDGLYLTQSTQTYASTVPLVAGRAGFLRVFVLANEGSAGRPLVRVRLTRPGAAAETLNIPGGGGLTPIEAQEGTLGSSWNIPVPANLIQPGLTVSAEVDPDNSVRESNEGDNRFPASGNRALTVQRVPVARIRFVSVQQGSDSPGDVTRTEQLLDLARRMHPLSAIDADVDPAVFTTGPLSANGDGWAQMLSDLDGKRLAEGTDRIYYGMVKLGYGRNAGLVGLTLGQGVPTAAGWDDAGDASRVVAHELGHVWNRKHSPCGGPPDVEALYPYSGGAIGVYGLDATPTVSAGDLKPPSSPDIMSYCFQAPWISDYTYREILRFRANLPSVRIAAAPQRSLLVRGRLVSGRLVLEPFFQIVSRPHLPTRSGPYSVTGAGVDGGRLFTLSFDMTMAQDAPSGAGHFAFAVPIDEMDAQRLRSIILQGPAGSVSMVPRVADLRAEAVLESIVVRRQGANVMLKWDDAVYPMIMVRDPDTGEVLTFARGGTALVRTDKGALDLDVSDGVKSQRLRLAINRS